LPDTKVLVKVDGALRKFESYDIVSVFDSAQDWGTKDIAPMFLRVRLKDLHYLEAQFLTRWEYEDDPVLIEEDTGGMVQNPKRKAWKVDTTKLTPPMIAQVEAALANNSELIIYEPLATIDWIRRKSDNIPPGQAKKK
jgi:hypothetical protein